MPDRAALLAGFRGTAVEVSELAKKLAIGSHYQPGAFTRNDLEKVFKLLLRPLLAEGDNEPWSLQRIYNETGVNKSTISEMRIALIALKFLPYDEDKFSSKTILNVWNLINNPDNANKSYEVIANKANVPLLTFLYYARIGRFAGKVASRDVPRTRPIDDLAPVKAALLGQKPSDEPTLTSDAYKQISSMLKSATDEEGHISETTIKGIAAHFPKEAGIGESIVKEVRIGLVALGDLPERKPINTERILAMWYVLDNNRTTPIPELAVQHGWEQKALERAGITGRLVGAVEPRVKRNKQRMIKIVLRLMERQSLDASGAAQRLKLNKATVREWVREALGNQQERVAIRRKRLLEAALKADPNLTNKKLGTEIGLSEKVVRTDLLAIVQQLEMSTEAADKAKLVILKPRLERMALGVIRQKMRKPAKRIRRPKPKPQAPN